MITSRDELLTAIRRAEITPQGLTVGPLVWVGGKSINFSKVSSEDVRRALLARIKLAGSRYFSVDTIWQINKEIPKCSAKTKPPKSRTTKAAKR